MTTHYSPINNHELDVYVSIDGKEYLVFLYQDQFVTYLDDWGWIFGKTVDDVIESIINLK